MVASDQARRLARHRVEFQRAIDDGVSLAEAKRRIAEDRWLAAQRKLQAKCGTAAGAVLPPRRGTPDEIPEQWWQRL